MDAEGNDRPAVVLVDDDLGVLASLKRLLRDEPFEVLATPSPLEALGWLTDRDVRAIVVDERMPEMTGSQLLGWVAARFPELPAVILTGYGETALTIAKDQLRIERLITKPWDDENLRDLLRDLTGFGRAIAQPVDCRIDCAGQTDQEILSRILPEIILAGESGRGLAIAFDHLDRLEGPLTRFLLSLIRLAGEYRVRLILRDASGLAATAVGAIRHVSSYVAAAGK